MEKQTYGQALLNRAKHIGALIATVPAWNGTNWTGYNEGMPLDTILVEVNNCWFFRPGNQRARIEFQDIKFKGFEGLTLGEVEKYDEEQLVVTDKNVRNRKGTSPITSRMSWEETNTKTREKGFKQALTVGAEVGFEAGAEYAKFSAKISTEATSEWDNRSISSHSETVKIDEEVSTPAGVNECIKVVLTKNKMRERIQGSVDLEHKVVVVSARPDNSYYYVLVWNSFSDFLRCVGGTAPITWTGVKEMRHAKFERVNLENVGNPSDAYVDTYNEYENALSLSIDREPI